MSLSCAADTSALRSSSDPNLSFSESKSCVQYLQGKGGAAISSRLSALARHDAPVVRLAVSEVALDVLDDGGDPDGVEAHAGDVVEVVLNRLPRPAAVLPVRRIARRAGVVL